MNCLAILLKEFQVDVYDDANAILSPLIIEPPVAAGGSASGENKPKEDDDDAKSKPLTLLIRANAYEALSAAHAAVCNHPTPMDHVPRPVYWGRFPKSAEGRVPAPANSRVLATYPLSNSQIGRLWLRPTPTRGPQNSQSS